MQKHCDNVHVLLLRVVGNIVDRDTAGGVYVAYDLLYHNIILSEI